MERGMNDQALGSAFAGGAGDSSARASRGPLGSDVRSVLGDRNSRSNGRERELVDAGTLALVAQQMNRLRIWAVKTGAQRPVVNFLVFAGAAALLCWCVA